MTTSFRLAHVTDPHFRSFDGAHLGDFLGKRAVGALNLVVNRRRKHKMQLLAALADDLRSEKPDHLALTGDLSNVSIEPEWRAALSWVEGLGTPPADVTIIPGNHDVYVPDVVARGTFERLFAPYQTRDVPDAPELQANARPEVRAAASDGYPFVRLRGPAALIAVNSCVATGDLGAWGQVGDAQRARLEAILTSPALAGRLRIVLIHHPPVKLKGGEDRNLRDRDALAAMLARAGADLVLHGHDHRDERATLPGPGGRPIPIVGAGSASYSGGPETRSRFNVYELSEGAITVVTRAHDEATDTFREVRRERLV